ncbi:MAG: hypothetical protein LBJ36_01995 [Synergistaceae bacterium]|jgi:hypothetical protein|nr:hypothetical protein [Synergistaceae bacterium]
MAESTMMRGILLPSKILDYLSQEDVNKKIESLLQKDKEDIKRRRDDFENMLESSLPEEEKARLMKDMINESFGGRASLEREQRLVALKLREDYAELKKNENRAFHALLAGNIPKYERCISKAADFSDLVDMGLEYLENLPEFLSSFKVKDVRFLSEEEAKQRDSSKVIHLKSIDSLFGV